MIFIAGMIFSNHALAQDIHFSQFYEHGMIRNPALTGVFSGDMKISANYRNQWSNISVPFQTFLVSGEMKKIVNKDQFDYVSFGLTATYDKSGSIDFTSLQILPAINYNKSLQDKLNSYLSVGFMAGYVQRSVDPTKMTFASQYANGGFDPNNPSGEDITNVSMSHWDLSAGISFNSSFSEERTSSYYLGLAAFHVLQPNESFNNKEALINLSTRWTAQAGFRFKLGNTTGLITHLNFNYQKPYTETVVGGLLSYTNYGKINGSLFSIYAGLFYRWNDAIIPTIKLDYDNVSFNLSYDATTSWLRVANNGQSGLELTVSMRNFFKDKSGARNLRCPMFELLPPSLEAF